MAGTLTISTLSDGTNSTSSTNCIQGSAKAWATFTGATPPVISASYNVSSVTRSATGTFAVNFTNALTDANYCTQTTVRDNVGLALYSSISYATTPTTSTFGISVFNANGTNIDPTTLYAACFR